MSKPVLIATISCLSLLGVAYSFFTATDVNPTPLSSFTAPFVYGHFKVPSENPLSKEGVALGRLLFYDKRLSGNNTVSCATCHLQRLAFTDGKAKSVGVSGRKLAFNSMSLANTLWGPQHFFWDGRAQSLEEQALIPIQHPDEMAQDLDELIAELKADEYYLTLFRQAYGQINAQNIAFAIASFERTLVSSNSKYDQFLRGELTLTGQEEHGRKLFMAHPDVKASLRGGNCIDCHSQFLTSGFKAKFDGFANNGLDSDNNLELGLEKVTKMNTDRGKFKVPTLRNIALTGPYMHDGRFETLEQVLDHYDQGIKISATLSPLIMEANNQLNDDEQMQISLNLNEDEKLAIIAFLHTLTDYTFISNEQFSNPFPTEQAQNE
ncbi:cytochrome c peroxidase [Thalassotalea fonticola]|uniref:Cytochrome c peroxidase n=1 Tax=Thalassotalea fonticola TaxID=3065649 RepID=A0ABZ0GV35_9GAMM|nr:cytochrome c peroxidase [Colwelliaceae bacterium S1-1]